MNTSITDLATSASVANMISVLRLSRFSAALRQEYLKRLIYVYSAPVRKRIRKTLPNGDADAIAEAFFADFIQQNTITEYSPHKEQFHVWLGSVLDEYVRKHSKNTKACDAETDFAADTAEVLLDQMFQYFVNDCFFAQNALHLHYYRVVELHDICKQTNIAIAQQLGLPQRRVADYLTKGRHLFCQKAQVFMEYFHKVLCGKKPSQKVVIAELRQIVQQSPKKDFGFMLQLLND